MTLRKEYGKDLLNGHPFQSLLLVPHPTFPPAFLFSQAWRPASFPPGGSDRGYAAMSLNKNLPQENPHPTGIRGV